MSSSAIPRSNACTCSFTSRNSATSIPMVSTAPSVTPGATIRAGWRSNATTSSAVRLRIRHRANTFSTVLRCSRRARSGVGARSHRVRNNAPQSPDRLPASRHIAGK